MRGHEEASSTKYVPVELLEEWDVKDPIANYEGFLLKENCFEFLDAPVKRVASIETPIPFAKTLEDNYLPKGRFAAELLNLLAY